MPRFWRKDDAPAERGTTLADGTRVEEPNQAELEWIGAQLEVAKELARVYAGDGGDLEPRRLDDTFAAWLRDWEVREETDRLDPNLVVNALGIAFGQQLVESAGMRWAVASDEHGTEIAVYAEPGEVLVFPTNLVAKRLDAREETFFEPLYGEIRRRVEALRSESG